MSTQNHIVAVGKALLPYLRDNLSAVELGFAAHDATAGLRKASRLAGEVTISSEKHDALMMAATACRVALSFNGAISFKPDELELQAAVVLQRLDEAVAALRSAGIQIEEKEPQP